MTYRVVMPVACSVIVQHMRSMADPDSEAGLDHPRCVVAAACEIYGAWFQESNIDMQIAVPTAHAVASHIIDNPVPVPPMPVSFAFATRGEAMLFRLSH